VTPAEGTLVAFQDRCIYIVASNPSGENGMASSQSPRPAAFRLRRPEQEFAEFAEAYIQRMLASRPDFDQALYGEASNLVLRKLEHYAGERRT
jgi:hypothetical protein